jgi:hypothetical protein
MCSERFFFFCFFVRLLCVCVLIVRSFSDQLNQMEHNWTMNDLLQLNLNNNESMNHQQQQHHHHSPQVSPISIKLERPVPTNKRSANIFTLDSSASKRLKSTLSVSTSPPAAVVPNLTLNDPKTSPNLLQQLMAPLTPALRAKLKTRTNDTGRWNRNNNGSTNSPNKDQQQQSQNGGHHQPSNSVLMNLLVSGCDVSAGYTCLPRPSKAAKA